MIIERAIVWGVVGMIVWVVIDNFFFKVEEPWCESKYFGIQGPCDMIADADREEKQSRAAAKYEMIQWCREHKDTQSQTLCVILREAERGSAGTVW